MFYKKTVIAVKCDRCFREILDSESKMVFKEEERHYCWECSFVNDYINEQEYLHTLGYFTGNTNAMVLNGEVVVWSGRAPWNESDHQDNRNTKEYKAWREKVILRDNKTCVTCGTKENLQAHHIKEFSKYPDLKYVLGNGITVCKSCHKEIHRKKDK